MKSALLALTCVVSLPIFSATASAAVLYTTTFPDAVDTIPSGWSALTGGAGSNGVNGWYMGSTGGNYRFDSIGTSSSGISTYTGPLANSTPSNALTDFTVSTTFVRTGGTSVGGVAGRIVDANNFYHLRLSANNTFNLFRFDGGSNTSLASVTIDAADLYANNEIWAMSMTFVGNQITGTLTDNDGKVVGAINYTDTAAGAISSGAAGFRAQTGYEFVSFNISDPIPEPSAVLLGSLGALGALSRRRRLQG